MEKEIVKIADKSLKKLVDLQNTDYNSRVKLVKMVSEHPVIKLMRKVQRIIQKESQNLNYLVKSIPYISRVPCIIIKDSLEGRWLGRDLKNPVFHKRLGIKGQSSPTSLSQSDLLLRAIKLNGTEAELFPSRHDRAERITIDLDPAMYSSKQVNQENLSFLLELLQHYWNDYRMEWKFAFPCGKESGALRFTMGRVKKEDTILDNVSLDTSFSVSKEARWNSDLYGFLGTSIEKILNGEATHSYNYRGTPVYADTDIDFNLLVRNKEKIYAFNRVKLYYERYHGFLKAWDKIKKSLNEFYVKEKSKFDLIESDFEKFKVKVSAYKTLAKLVG